MHINEFNTELKNREEAASARATKASELAAAAGITFSKDSKKNEDAKSKDGEEEAPFGDDENTDEEEAPKKKDSKDKKEKKFSSISYTKPTPAKSQKVVQHLPKARKSVV